MELVILIIIVYILFYHRPVKNKVDFGSIPIRTFFCFKGVCGSSEWLKINDERAICIDNRNHRVRFELNQEKPFTPNTIVYRLENEPK